MKYRNIKDQQSTVNDSIMSTLVDTVTLKGIEFVRLESRYWLQLTDVTTSGTSIFLVVTGQTYDSDSSKFC